MINELTEVATKWKALLSSGSEMLRVRKRIENEIEQCLNLFDKYHGIPSSGKIPDKYRLERRLLNYGLDIVGKVLNLEKVLPIFQQIIETDFQRKDVFNPRSSLISWKTGEVNAWTSILLFR